jgi:uncharacterized membrane protein YkoI
MRKTWTVIGIVLVVILVIGGVATSAHQAKQTGSIQIKSDDEAGYAGKAKISFDSAVNAALQAVPGKVLKAELENENRATSIRSQQA